MMKKETPHKISHASDKNDTTCESLSQIMAMNATAYVRKNAQIKAPARMRRSFMTA